LVDKATEDVTHGDIDNEFVEKYLSETVIEKLSADLYDVLCALTSDEAITVVRSEVGKSGFKAWRNLFNRSSPVALARTLAALMDLIKPPRITDVTVIPKAIDPRTLKLNTFEKDHEDTLSPRVTKAILLSGLPQDIQDLMHSNAWTSNTYEDARGEVKADVRAGKGGTPTDIGKVTDKSGENNECETEINAMSKEGGQGAGHMCGEAGHFARECPKGRTARAVSVESAVFARARIFLEVLPLQGRR
jgi:hypothetical protein